jgi:hypothetical protein
MFAMSEHSRDDVGVVHLAPGQPHPATQLNQSFAELRTILQKFEVGCKSDSVGKRLSHGDRFDKELWARDHRQVFPQNLPTKTQARLGRTEAA